MEPQKRTCVAVIGCGDMGQKHANIYARHEAAELVALVDTRQSVVEPAAAALGVKAFDSVDALFDAWIANELELDAIDVCLPNALHADVTARALGDGLHVLCEKPPANDLAGAEAIERAAASSNALVMFGFVYRYHPVVREQLAGTYLGRLVRGEIRIERRDGIPDRPAFRNRALTGGGPLVDLLCHGLAVLGDVVGFAPLATVVGSTYPAPDAWGENGVEEQASGMLTFARSELVEPNATIALSTSWRAHLPAGEPDESWTMRLIGTNGSVALTFPTGAELAQAGYEAEIDHFLAHVRSGWASSYDGAHEGLWVQRITDALIRSASTGEAVDLRTPRA